HADLLSVRMFRYPYRHPLGSRSGLRGTGSPFCPVLSWGSFVFFACWAAKGGSGTTVVASCLALLRAGRETAGAVLADLAGDVPATLGVSAPDSPGLAEWLAAGNDVPGDALVRLEISAAPGLALLVRGQGPLASARAGVLAALFERSTHPVVADCGSRPDGAAAGVVGAASRSLLGIPPRSFAPRHAAPAPA